MVRSVIDISLSIDPTSPTILRCECARACACVILAALNVRIVNMMSGGGNRTLRDKLGDKFGPFCPENVSTSERAISAAYNKRVNAFFDQVVGSSQTTFDSPECG